LRLDECGTYAGLVSKLHAEYTSSKNILNNKRNSLFGEYFVVDLLENLFLTTGDDTASTVNFDNLWHIISLLSITNTIDLNIEMSQIIRMRLRVYQLIIAFLFASPHTITTIRLLTKPPAWQDLLCQYLCIGRNQLATINSNNHQIPPPSIVVLSTSSHNATQQTPLNTSASHQKSKTNNLVLSPIDQSRSEMKMNGLRII